MRLVTERDLKDENPLFPSSQFFKDFILLNMWPDGVWLVDKQHSLFEKMKETALEVANSFGDKESIERINNFCNG
ncbi:hypothetical protein [Pedobacter sp. Leaf170]|uniref:hypothetical protein n=1 Tax=Pedobacter sp. Leaf170 TaxID=2876558 RepID=UPI001E3B82FD|nr:hypothetical protein [Pedobacter sp. Leaf170]